MAKKDKYYRRLATISEIAEFDRMLITYYGDIKDLGIAQRANVNDEEFVYALTEEVLFYDDQLLYIDDSSEKIGESLLCIYDENPSYFEKVTIKKNLIDKYSSRVRPNTQIKENFEKMVRVFLKAQDSMKTADYIIGTCIISLNRVDPEIGETSRSWILKTPFKEGYYLYEYLIYLIEKFPNMESKEEGYYEWVSDIDGKTLREKLEQMKRYFPEQKNFEPIKNQKQKLRTTIASYNSNSEFYKSVLNMMESFSENPTRMMRYVQSVYLRLSECLSSEDIERYIKHWEEVFGRSDRINWRNPKYENKMDYYSDSSFVQIGKYFNDKNDSKSYEISGINTEFLNSLSDNDENLGRVSSLAVLEKQFLVRLYQLMQLSGEISIFNLLENNKLKKKDVKSLVNYTFISYKKLTGKSEPKTSYEKYEFTGTLLDHYIIRILISERASIVNSYYNLVSDKKTVNVNQKTLKEKQALLNGNKALIEENAKLKRQIKELKEGNEVKSLKEKKRKLQSKIKDLKKELKRTNDILEETNKEKLATEFLLLEYEKKAEGETFIESVNEATEESFQNLLKTHKILLWGARYNKISEYESKYPGLTVVACEAKITRRQIEQYDCVIVKADFCGHTYFWNIRELCANANIPHMILTKGQTNDRYIWDAADRLLRKEDQSYGKHILH